MFTEKTSLVGISKQTSNRKQDLLYAAEKGDLDKVKTLLSRGHNIDQVNIVGKTPLILAATNGHVEVVRYLCKKGADIDLTDKGSWPALEYAKSRNDPKVVDKYTEIVDILQRYSFIRRKCLNSSYS